MLVDLWNKEKLNMLFNTKSISSFIFKEFNVCKTIIREKHQNQGQSMCMNNLIINVPKHSIVICKQN